VSRNIDYLRRNNLGAQIMLYDTNWICNYPTEKVARLGRLLQKKQIPVTAHGPVHDMNPGSLDVIVRDYTRHCYFKTLAVCHSLGAKSLVLHLGLNPLLPDAALSSWLEESVRVWRPLVELVRQLGMTIRLENMFVPTPRFIIALKDALGADVVKVCFDIGHFNVYSDASLSQWLDELGPDIEEVHLNDNTGRDDEHLGLGKGTINFRRFFRELAARRIRPQFTLEMTSDKFQESIDYLVRKDVLAVFGDA
jgi:sugar phosphate isomerase/epimerase